MRQEYHLWIRNITNREISISDLNISIRPYCIVDLFRDGILTYEEIYNSYTKGTLSKRLEQKSLIALKKPPEKEQQKGLEVSKEFVPRKHRTLVKPEEKTFKELEVFDLDEQNDLAEEIINFDIPDDNKKK